MPVEPQEMSHAEAGDALAPQAGDFKAENLHLMCVFSKLNLS